MTNPRRKFSDLKSRLTTFKTAKKMIIDDQFYSAVLTAVSVPALGGDPVDSNVHFLEVKASTSSVIQNNTVYICSSSMQQFKQKLESLIDSIKQLTKKSALDTTFLNAGQSFLDQILPIVGDMTDIITLMDQLASIISITLKTKSLYETDISCEYDSLLKRTIDMNLTILRESVLSEPDIPYELRNHNLLRSEGNLRKIFNKYYMKQLSDTSNASEQNLSEVVRVLFEKTTTVHSMKLRIIKQSHNEGSVLKQLKAYLQNLNMDAVQGYKRSNFPSSEAYENYISRERKFLSSVSALFAQKYPNAALLMNNAKIINIPPANKLEKYFQDLIGICLDSDLKGNTGIVKLSKTSNAILGEVALRWGLAREYKEIAIFQQILERYADGTLGIIEAQQSFRLLKKIADPQKLRLNDSKLILECYQNLLYSLDNQMQQFLNLIENPKFSPEGCQGLLNLTTFLIFDIYEEPIYIQNNRGLTSKEEILVGINDNIEKSANNRIENIIARIEESYSEEGQEVLRIVKIIQIMANDLKKFKYYYPLENIFIPKIAALSYIQIANSLISAITGIDAVNHMNEVLELYGHIHELYDVSIELEVQRNELLDIQELFIPLLDQWLNKSDIKWAEWSKRAYELDRMGQFEPVLSPYSLNSNSVIDLFNAFQSAFSFISKFAFENPNQKINLKRKLIKAMHQTITTYCDLNYADFMELGTKSITPAPFDRSLIIQCNNMLLAQELFSDLLQTFDALLSEEFDKLSEPEKTDDCDVAYYLKIKGARNLNYRDPDAFVLIKMNDEAVAGTEIAKSNTNPIWNQHCKIILPKQLNNDSKAFLKLEVFHDNPFGNEILIGFCSIFLRNEKLNDLLTYQTNISMHEAGTLQVRIRKEGNIEATEWNIKRTQEVIRFTIEDMVESMIGQILWFLELTVENIFNSNKGTNIIGNNIEIVDENVENEFLIFLNYLDSCLGMINQSFDRRFNHFFQFWRPEMGMLQEDIEKSQIDQMDKVISKEYKEVNDRNRLNVVNVKENPIDCRRPPVFIHLIWHDILVRILSMIVSYQANDHIPNEAIRKIKIIDCVVECLKALFFCENQNGLDLNQLETDLYEQIRANIDLAYGEVKV